MIEQDFVFDLNAMLETHPAMQRDVKVYLEALCHHNPTVERRVCALLGGRIMAQLGRATPGNEATLMAALEWLQGETKGMGLVDPDGVMSEGLKASGAKGAQ